MNAGSWMLLLRKKKKHLKIPESKPVEVRELQESQRQRTPGSEARWAQRLTHTPYTHPAACILCFPQICRLHRLRSLRNCPFRL